MRGFAQLLDLPICVALAVFLSTCAKVVMEARPAPPKTAGTSSPKPTDLLSNRCLPCLWLTASPTVTVNGINTLFGDSGRTEAVVEFAKACRLN